MTTFQELQMYKNFNELANDLLDLAKEILPGHLIYLTSHSDTQQVILKFSNEDTSIVVGEGLVLNLNDTLCNRINFQENEPLVYEDTKKESSLTGLQSKLDQMKIRSYLGLPISHINGEKFGTLCAVNDKVSHFDPKNIQLLQKIVRMFSYYLDLERLAFRDALTDLYNRRYLFKFFESHSEAGGVIYYLDLDGFKRVNDFCGHDEGDQVLKEVASRLQRLVADGLGAFVVRIGGDEFVIHFSGVSDKEEINEQAEAIIHAVSAWGQGYALSASVWIASYPANYKGALEPLLKQADEALYLAKAEGKNTYKFF